MRRGSTRFFGRAAAAVAADEAVEAEAAVLTRLPDGKILSLSFLGLRQDGRCKGAIQGREGIKFCSVA